MPTMQDNLRSHDLCRQLVAEPDPKQRAEAIAEFRALIEEERSSLQSPEEASYLRVAEMVLDFLEEALDSRDRELIH